MTKTGAGRLRGYLNQQKWTATYWGNDCSTFVLAHHQAGKMVATRVMQILNKAMSAKGNHGDGGWKAALKV